MSSLQLSTTTTNTMRTDNSIYSDFPDSALNSLNLDFPQLDPFNFLADATSGTDPSRHGPHQLLSTTEQATLDDIFNVVDPVWKPKEGA